MPADGSYDEQLERAIDARLALVAHELTGPLVVAQGFARILADELAGAESRGLVELAERSASNLTHGLHLLQRLRDTAASNEDLQLVRERIDLGTLVEETIADLGSTVAEDHPVTVTTPDEPVCIDADAARLRQVLFNLTVNAAKYTDAGAPIEVTLTGGERAVIEVRNHGFGVAPEDAERLFQRGVRGAGSGPDGLGVGLYVSRTIAEAHGGDLHVEPAEVRGSRFILQLPTAA